MIEVARLHVTSAGHGPWKTRGDVKPSAQASLASAEDMVRALAMLRVFPEEFSGFS
jgi:hypothetical protein